MTFKEVKEFIEGTTVNSYGYTKCKGNFRLQIWNNKSQFNVNRCNDESDYGLAQLAVVLKDDEVHIYQCRDGYADYDTYTAYAYNEDIKHSQLKPYTPLFT